ncbi:MAG: hypothetical protein AB7T74_11210 [Clostridia bacterium]|nr:hypothetical protein [Spirochaetia bacterium]
MSSTDWREMAYESAYTEAYRSLERRHAEDPDFTPEDVKGVLKHLYFSDGSDWVGRGEVQELHMKGVIEAHEHFLLKWEQGKESRS